MALCPQGCYTHHGCDFGAVVLPAEAQEYEGKGVLLGQVYAPNTRLQTDGGCAAPGPRRELGKLVLGAGVLPVAPPPLKRKLLVRSVQKKKS